MNKASAARARFSPKTLLVVGHQLDSSSELSNILGILFPRCRVESAITAEEAYLRLVKGGVDAVLCEEELPKERSGLALWKLLRTRGPNVPFVLMSDRPPSGREGHPGSEPDTLVKPIEPESLERSLNKAVTHATEVPKPRPKIEVVRTKCHVTIHFELPESAQASRMEAYSLNPVHAGRMSLFSEQGLEKGVSVTLETPGGEKFSGVVVASTRLPQGRTLQAKPFPFSLHVDVS